MRESIDKKILDVPSLLRTLDELRSQGKRIVQCHGCFDVVHPGHIRHLTDAAEHGDALVVSVTADPQVNKGVGRPLMPEELRCENLAALSVVNYVVVDRNSWAGPLLEQIRPDVYVKGLEYTTNSDPRFLRERQIVESYGGVVVFTSGEVVYSSTRLQQSQFDRDDARHTRLRAVLARHDITRASLESRVAQFEGVEVVVIGDAILDHYVECEQGGISAEAPVLQVSPIDERYYVGGAGVLALHAARLGAKVRFVGFLGEPGSSGAPSIREVLEENEVEVIAIPAESTLVKTRFLVEGQKVFKVDRCRPMSITSAQERDWLAHFEGALGSGAGGVIAIDFGYGALNQTRMLRVSELARSAGARVFGDTSSGRYASLGKFAGSGCDAVFPSEAEARSYLGEPETGLSILASELFARNVADAIALTLGPRGLVLFDRSRQSTQADGSIRYLPEYLPALTAFPVDPLGAGDALTTVASLTRMTGGGYVEAALLGSVASAMVVQKLGNDPIQRQSLLRFIDTSSLFDTG